MSTLIEATREELQRIREERRESSRIHDLRCQDLCREMMAAESRVQCVLYRGNDINAYTKALDLVHNGITPETEILERQKDLLRTSHHVEVHAKLVELMRMQKEETELVLKSQLEMVYEEQRQLQNEIVRRKHGNSEEMVHFESRLAAKTRVQRMVIRRLQSLVAFLEKEKSCKASPSSPTSVVSSTAEYALNFSESLVDRLNKLADAQDAVSTQLRISGQHEPDDLVQSMRVLLDTDSEASRKQQVSLFIPSLAWESSISMPVNYSTLGLLGATR